MWGADNASGDTTPGTHKERDGVIHPKDPGQHPNQGPTENHTAWNISHPKPRPKDWARLLCSFMARDKRR